MATTFTVEPVAQARLDKILRQLLEAVGEVDLLAMKTAMKHQDFRQDHLEAFRAQMGGESVEMPTLEGDFDAASAWHLHQFATDVRQAAKDAVRYADMIDEAAHGLYLHFNEHGGSDA